MNNEQKTTTSTATRSLDDYPDVLTAHDLSEILRIHTCTVYEMLRNGQLPYLRIGSAYRISKKALIEHLS